MSIRHPGGVGVSKQTSKRGLGRGGTEDSCPPVVLFSFAYSGLFQAPNKNTYFLVFRGQEQNCNLRTRLCSYRWCVPMPCPSREQAARKTLGGKSHRRGHRSRPLFSRPAEQNNKYTKYIHTFHTHKRALAGKTVGGRSRRGAHHDDRLEHGRLDRVEHPRGAAVLALALLLLCLLCLHS